MKTISILILNLVISTSLCFSSSITEGNTYKLYTRTPSAKLSSVLSYGNLLFFKDYVNSQSSLNADYSAGGYTATFTSTRSSTNTSTYVDSSGVLHDVTTSDVPRYQGGYYDSTGFHSQPGLMIEGSSVNLMKYGAPNSNFAWSGYNLQVSGSTRLTVWTNNGGAANLTLPNDPTIVADATRYVIGIQVTNAGTLESSVNLLNGSSAFGVTNGTKYAVSFYLKTDSSKTIPIYFTRSGGASLGTLSPASITTIAGQWVRYVGTVTATDTQSDGCVSIRLGNNGLFQSYIYGIQVEANNYVTSLIPTSSGSGGTRGAESLSYSSANRNPVEESIFVRFAPEWSTTAPGSGYDTQLGLLTTNGSVRDLTYRDTSGSVRFRPNYTDSSGVSIWLSTQYAANTLGTVAATCKYNNNPSKTAIIYWNGSEESSSTTNWTANPFGSSFYVGAGSTYVQNFYGVIQSVTIYNRMLSGSEVSGVNTILSN